MKNLKIRQRHAEIIAALRHHGSLSVSELASLVGVSEETVRRDARPLEERGEVVKLHGALALPHDITEARFERRMRDNAPAKLAIARAAVEMVRDGDSLIIDTGSTTTFFARELRRRSNLTVITNSIEIGRLLADVSANKVYLAGGEMDAANGAAFGPTAVDFIAKFHVKHTFLSVSGLDLKAGPTDAQFKEAEFAAMAVTRADNCVLLADASKFGRTSFVKVCGFSEIHAVVTETPPEAAFFSTLREHGTKLVIAGS